MVSLWPWKGDDTSPASFEKTLSSLSTKISKLTARLDSSRGSSRRFKALWTLYSSFAYLLYLMIEGLVVGWRAWGLIEYTALAGAPLLIYVIRAGLTISFDYRISSLQVQLDGLLKQREVTIDKLKTATKYNTTQQLLEKYGASPPSSKSDAPTKNKSPGPLNPKKAAVSRTGLSPPATANIPGRIVPASVPSTPTKSLPVLSPAGIVPPYTAAAIPAPWQHEDGAVVPDDGDFAPNAFPAAPQYATATQQHQWYDRIMDVLLGEDESSPRNRLALICERCRLVNGLAPPGVKTLEAVGQWRCSSCSTMNGEEPEAKRLIAEMKNKANIDQASSKMETGHSSHQSDEQAPRAAAIDEDASKAESHELPAKDVPVDS